MALAFVEDRTDHYICARQAIPLKHSSRHSLRLQRKLGARLPIVFITAHGNIAMAVHAMKAGAADFRAKPVRDTDLVRAKDSMQAAADGLRCVSASTGSHLVSARSWHWSSRAA
jgi:FixJ family two-component response regulator